jgi:perosamine synthetase
MSHRFIPVNNPTLTGNEKKYVMDCLESSWISSVGKYVKRFESAFAQFCGVKYAVSCSNGTAALHLALLALGVKPGDEIIVQSLTFIATANAVTYCGARPVFVDSESETWNIDPEQIETRINSRTKGIIVVHFRGQPAEMDSIMGIARRHGLFVVEDAAQAHGAEYKGRKAGSIGEIGTFSFFGNKIVTTGEGGMVVTNDAAVDERIRLLKNQGMTDTNRYWHPVVGYNYRMTNVAAALGLAQLEKIDVEIKGRSEVATWYREYLKECPGIVWQRDKEGVQRVWFLFSLMIDRDGVSIRDKLIPFLLQNGIDTRPVYCPIHTLPPYSDGKRTSGFSVAERVSQRGINLPTWAGLSREDVKYICQKIMEYTSTLNLL